MSPSGLFQESPGYHGLIAALEAIGSSTGRRLEAEELATFGLSSLLLPEMLAGKRMQLALLDRISNKLRRQQRRTSDSKARKPVSGSRLFSMLRDCYSLDPGNKDLLDAFRALAVDMSGGTSQQISEAIRGKCVVVHVSCEKRIQSAKESAISFLPCAPDEVHLLVTGNPERVKFSSCSLGFRFSDNNLAVDAPDNYEGHCTKVMLLYTLLHLMGPPRCVVKLDDDVHLHNRFRFNALIKAFAKGLVDYSGFTVRPTSDSFYQGWHVGKCEDRRFDWRGHQYPLPSSFARGGDGYVLGEQSLSVLATSFLNMRSFFSAFPMLEDVSVGLMLQLYGISLLEHDLVGARSRAAVKPVFSSANDRTSDYDQIRRLNRSSLRHKEDEHCLYRRRLERLFKKQ
jgi:hypothetical protein